MIAQISLIEMHSRLEKAIKMYVVIKSFLITIYLSVRINCLLSVLVGAFSRSGVCQDEVEEIQKVCEGLKLYPATNNYFDINLSF